MARPIYQRVAVTDAGDVIPGAEYTVTNENTGTEQTIYDARSGGSVIRQPAFADANGVIQFWTEPGVTYRVEATGGVGTYTDRYVEADTRMTDLSDPASGSLMPPGAFGVGDKLSKNLNDSSQLAVNSFNAFTTPLFGAGTSQGWPFTSNWWGGIKLPTTFSTYAPYLLNNLTELYYGTANVADGTEGGVPWRKIYDQRNILGTVSQSGGVPTGAVIERGSNANGEYVKFADGTLICVADLFYSSVAMTTGFLGAFRSAEITWTFPHPFTDVEEYVVHASIGRNNTNASFCRTINHATGSVGVYALRNSSGLGSVDVQYIAIGRWF